VSDVDLHTRGFLFNQQIDKVTPILFDVFKGEVFEIEMILGALDSGKNRPEARLAVVQDRYLVPDRQRAVGDGFGECQVTAKNIDIGRLTPQLVEDKLTLLCGERTAGVGE